MMINEMMINKLSESLDNDVIKFLNKKHDIVLLLLDWLLLVKCIEGISIEWPQRENGVGRFIDRNTKISRLFNDYSFLIAPAYKAFEGYLYLLAESLGLSKVRKKIQNIGNLYDSDWIENIKEEIVTETGEKIDKSDKDGMEILDGLRRVLRHYRHNPAHFGGKIDTFQKAKDYVSMILAVINDTTKYFLSKGLIKT